MQLTECCVTVCETLENMIQGKNAGDLDESERMAVEKLEKYVNRSRRFSFITLNGPRAMREIELTLRRGTSTPHTRYDKEKIENRVQEVQRLLDTLNVPSSPDEKLCAAEHALTLGGPPDATITSASEEGMSSSPLSDILWNADHSRFSSHNRNAACGRLIRRAFLPHELPFLIEVILSNKDKVKTIHRLPVDDAQMLIDVMYEARSPFNRHRKFAS